MDELMKMVYATLGFKPETEKQRAERIERNAKENCEAGKHRWTVLRDGTRYCDYCQTVGDSVHAEGGSGE